MDAWAAKVLDRLNHIRAALGEPPAAASSDNFYAQTLESLDHIRRRLEQKPSVGVNTKRTKAQRARLKSANVTVRKSKKQKRPPRAP